MRASGARETKGSREEEQKKEHIARMTRETAFTGSTYGGRLHVVAAGISSNAVPQKQATARIQGGDEAKRCQKTVVRK